MDDTRVSTNLNEIIDRLRNASWKERDVILADLRALVEQEGLTPALIRQLEDAKKTLPLEVRWDVDEVIEAFTEKPPEEEEAEVEDSEEDANKALAMSDLNVVYDDPRGLVLHKSKVGERWFATQPDQYSGQPKMFELGAPEIQQLKTQLAGSPYWVLGTGGAA